MRLSLVLFLLCASCFSADRKVVEMFKQREKIFALGQSHSPSSLPDLLEANLSTNPETRAFAIEALGKTATPAAIPALKQALTEENSNLRAEAALGLYRLHASKPSPESAEEKTTLLIEAIKKETNEATRWKMVFSVAAIGDKSNKETLLRTLKDYETLCRNFAAWGLGKIPIDQEIEAELRAVLSDRDDAVVTRAALSLSKGKSEKTMQALLTLLRHKSFHVRRAAVESLGNFSTYREQILPSLRRALLDKSETVRAETFLSQANLIHDEAFPLLEEHSKDSAFLSRVKIAEATKYLSEANAQFLLQKLVHDADVRVASTAVASLKERKTEWAHSLALEALQNRDLSICGEAALTLAEIGNASDLPQLESAYENSKGHELSEARENILIAAEKLCGKEATPLLGKGLKDSNRSVRMQARESLEKTSGVKLPDANEEASRRWIFGSQPIFPSSVELQTTRGKILIELFPEYAPEHVVNFLALVKSGHYDGTIFHRVVSNWVVQGGDHRGDGWGATSSKGDHLPDELNPLHYRRGSVGMPKGAHPGTGGCQIFITLLPTPKLDGNYTCFGQVIKGLELLDQFEIGDQILKAEIR